MVEKVGFLNGNETRHNPAAPESEMGLLEYWKLVRKRSAAALSCMFAVLIIGTTGLLIVPWNYQSTSRIELNFATASPLDQLGLPSGAADLLGGNTDNEIGTEINALESEPLMIKIINDQGLFLDPKFTSSRRARENKENPEPWYSRPEEREKELTHFSKMLEVEADTKSFDVDVSFSHPDAVVSRKVLDDLLSSYIERRVRTRYDTVMQTTQWLNGELGGFKKTVEDSQRAVSDFSRTHQIIEASSQPSISLGGGMGGGRSSSSASSAGSNSIEVQQLVDLNGALASAKSAALIAEAKYRLSQSQDPDAMSSVFSDEILSAAKVQLSGLQVQLAEARARLGLRHPHVVELEKSVQAAQTQVNSRMDALRAGFKNDYEAATSNQKLLQKQVDDFTKHTTSRLDDYLQYEILKGELDSNMSLYQGLKQQLQEAGITASLDATHVNILNPPEVPYKYNSPKFFLIIPGLFVLSLIMGGLGAIAADHLDDSLLLPSQVEELVQLPIIGVVPHFDAPATGVADPNAAKEAPDPSIVTSQPNSPASEAYRTVRTSLLLMSSTPPKVILLTSSTPSEGKSVTAINIATALAQRGSKVLLVDGDLRKPTTLVRFGLAGRGHYTGLSEVLTQGYSILESAFISVGKTKTLTLLPAGAKPPIPGDLLESDAARDLFIKLREQFDYIVIDSPPVLAVNDPLILGRYADAVLLVVRARLTPKSGLLHTVRKIMTERLPIKGIIFTDLNFKSQEYRYSAYHYAYDNKYYSDSQ